MADLNPKPGDSDFRNYWVYGAGRPKWHTWTELYTHLLKYMTAEKAKRIAASWFHLRYGFWPGSDVNRIRTGHQPRGKKVGPG